MGAPSLLSTAPESFALRRGRGVVSLHATGIRHPRQFSGEGFTAYPEITQLLDTGRALRMGTRSSVYRFPRSLFVDPQDQERLQHAILERIAREPGGAEQLTRMGALDRLGHSPSRVRASLALAVACVVAYVLERRFDPDVALAGTFNTTLFWAGEFWRVLTANLLHADLSHLIPNLLFLLLLGVLVEVALGSTRTAFVIGASALGAMGGSLARGYDTALGASGIVLGLLGAALWLEFRCTDRLPVTWRVPRRLLLVFLLFAGAVSFFVRGVAGAAHVGGFLAGIAATAAVAPSALRREAARPWLTLTNAALGLCLLLSIAAMAREVGGDATLLARRGARLLRLPDVPPLLLNNTAWMIATSKRATEEQVALAVRLAERAVEETDRQDPNLLDTLAESQFAAGRADEAVQTIDEAIALRPEQPYFTEQRRRFTGERGRDDRPAPPPDDEDELTPPQRPPSSPPENPGVTV
ncbi:MAG TPA: rhomboid family intramembrane serine protease [Myxococcota bacterium]|nr:rhomboid family intramembrane serine protease [Myxococcota bacterium]